MVTREYRRRDVVRTAGLVAGAGAAGCLGDEDDDSEDDGEAAAGDDSGNDDLDDDSEDDGDGEVESDDGGDEPGDPEDDDSGADDTAGDETDSGEGETEDDSEDNEPEDDDTVGGETGSGEGETGDDPANGDDTAGEETDPGDDSADDSEDGIDDSDREDEPPEDVEVEGEDADGEGSDEDELEGDDSAREGDTDGEDGEGTTEVPDGFDTYTDEELGYAVSHPSGWEIEEGESEVYIGDPDGGRELGILVFDAAAFDSAEALAAEFLAGLEADHEDVELREEADRTLESGEDARLLDIAYDNPDDDRGRRRSRLLFVIDPDTDAGYVAEVAASAEAFDDAFEERADAMLASFRLEGDGLDRAGWFTPVFSSVSVLKGMVAGRLP